MSVKNLYSMSDEAIAAELGGRIEQLRLEADITQESIAGELGITTKTYRAAIKGRGKFATLIGILRVLGQLELVTRFIPETPFSPMALLELQGRQRQRATGAGGRKKEPHVEEDLGW
jgi:transcriptional regulator with XRE-family HTH domain